MDPKTTKSLTKIFSLVFTLDEFQFLLFICICIQVKLILNPN